MVDTTILNCECYGQWNSSRLVRMVAGGKLTSKDRALLKMSQAIKWFSMTCCCYRGD
jgi:hypothetical protein